MSAKNSATLNLFFEAGELKRIARSGWWLCKVERPESVAEHSFRTALIAFHLAKEEKIENPEKLAFYALLHDLPEARLTDLHRIASSYLGKKNKEKAEEAIMGRQMKELGAEYKLTGEERKIIKDADVLETMLQAKEYASAGYSAARHWVTKGEKELKTGAGKKIAVEMKGADVEWWRKQ